jgi:hypothetical protein
VKNLGRWIFGFRDDLDLSQRWWHRLVKVAYILNISVWALWFGFTIPADLPSGSGNMRIVETLSEYVIANPNDGDPVASFSKKYGYRSGKREADGSVSFAFFETSLYCAVRPYEHLSALAAYLRPTGQGRPTEEDALKVLQTLNIERSISAEGYTCVEINNETPHPKQIVGWEHTLRAQIIGNIQKYGVLLVVISVLSLIAMNLYYRGLVYVICGPRPKATSTREHLA